ncbi:DmsC/YnfH family molybdoenzyme membrane anchor subunit [Planctellipticum variicoloris]|uniref:DmsC/YnfH family molybdoenzyme membrane anchor subunit n=1 Tax=Planctellipticum variicoloris TaxID=3064265 RepID=UPI0030135BA2|nr:dimethyl sulfoxide reductase anchor subunit [Planctomycetaceae bacterium SH412]
MKTDLPLPVLESPSLPSFLEELLGAQQDLTAVERFAQLHAADTLPAQAKYYRSLLPAKPPGPGEQYAFEVDLDRCSGCKACVTACHSLNGLDEHETWRDVGLLVGGTSSLPVIQHVTAACHHCVDPACMNGCPTRAYEKDPVTGIVRHLDDQCFGCQYCVLACPYDVPKYSHKKGIVRKCDMCSQRLAVGEAPACVQACPHEAIRIQVVSKADVAADCEANVFLPGAPDPQLTVPTTTYRTQKVFPRNMLPADYYNVRIEDAHAPLIVMLVLTQLSVGACFVSAALYAGATTPMIDAIRPWQAVTALCFGLLALGSSTLHLGRPHLAWRAFLGLRTSWLSREIVAFGVFAKTAALYAAGMTFLPWLMTMAVTLWYVLQAGVLLSGLAGVFCSAMIYHWTRRPTWSGPRTFLRFFGTAAWLGLTATLLAATIAAALSRDLSVGPVLSEFVGRLGWPLMTAAAAKLAYEAQDLLHRFDRHHTSLKRVARLQTGPLSLLSIGRFTLGVLGGLVLPWMMLQETAQTSASTWVVLVGLTFGLSLAGELAERTLFFMTAVAPRMPGAVRT